ncbi:MAG: hypothetical protein ABI778_09200 [Ignavibacteriota bacterium]
MKSTMACAFINNVPVAQGQLTVVLSNNADKVMSHSCRIAKSAHKAGLSVLLINCGMSDHSFREHAGSIEVFTRLPRVPAPLDMVPQLVIHTSVRGDLICERDAIDEIVTNLRMNVVIIAGWEWTSATWRRKEMLLYYFREMLADENVAIIVYSQATTNPAKGAFDRGGLGKLSMLAGAIIRDDTAVELERVAPQAPPLVTTAADWAAAERSAQLLAKEINGLQGTIPQSESSEEATNPIDPIGLPGDYLEDKKPVRQEFSDQVLKGILGAKQESLRKKK